MGEVALLFADAGLITIVSFISPYRSDRECIRAMIGRGRFVEVYLDVAVDVCEERDVKGLYKRARAGDIGEFTGVSAPYEPPAAPEVSLKTDQLTVAESVTVIHDYLHEHELV